jgi:hypothetical protein
MKDYKTKAQEFANTLQPIKDVSAPREVKDAGRYYGFVKGYEAALNDLVATIQACPDLTMNELLSGVSSNKNSRIGIIMKNKILSVRSAINELIRGEDLNEKELIKYRKLRDRLYFDYYSSSMFTLIIITETDYLPEHHKTFIIKRSE